MMHGQEEARWKYYLQLAEQQRCSLLKFKTNVLRQLLGTKLAEEKAQLCQDVPHWLREVSLGHRRKDPLNPDVEVMTLHP
jgi:hypothetical protein